MSASDVATLVKQAVDIVDVVGQAVPLRRVGSKRLGLCPFHQEKTPSFYVDGENQLFHCFGCGAGGDVLTFVMRHRNIPFMDAVKYLADRYSIQLPREGQSAEASREERNRFHQAVKVAADFFYSQLHHSELGREAREYLRKRSLPVETVEEQRLGYAPNRWDGLLQYLKRSGIDQDLGVTAGLLVKKANGRYYDRFRHRLIFPITDEHGRVVAFGGRSLDGSEPKYLNSPETPIYHKGRMLYQLARAREACRRVRQVVLVEGYMDLLAFHAQGFYRVVATLGTALTPQQVRLLAHMADEVVLLYDADAAGEKAMFRAVPLFLQEQLTVTCIRLPEGMDPDDFLKARGLSAFEGLMQDRQDLITYVIRRIMEGWDGTTSGKTRVLAELHPIYVAMRQPVLKSECLRLISERLSVSERIIERQFQGAGRVHGKHPAASLDGFFLPEAPQTQSPEESIVRIMVKYPVLMEDVKVSGALDHFQEPRLHALAETLLQCPYPPHGEFNAAAVYELLQEPDLKGLFTRILMEWDTDGDLDTARLRIQHRLKALCERQERKAPRNLRESLRQAELKGDTDQVRRLLEEIQNLCSAKKKARDLPENA